MAISGWTSSRSASGPEPPAPWQFQLSERLAPHNPDIICGPLVEGAFLGLLVADELDAEFIYTQPQRDPDAPAGLFPVRYRLPAGLRQIEGRRVAIVNDVINAGSAVRGTLADLNQCSAEVVAIGTLPGLGTVTGGTRSGGVTPAGDTGLGDQHPLDS